MKKKFNVEKILNYALISTAIIVAILTGIVFMTSCSTKDKKYIMQGYEVVMESIQVIRNITGDLCDTGVIEADDCIKLEALYLAVDVLKSLLDELVNEIFQSNGMEKQQLKIAEYVLKLSEFNSAYAEIMKIFLKYN
jgi:hypothetical protein